MVTCTAGSGKLDADEFAAGMAAELGATRTQADKTFKGLDTDGSGDITLDEMGALFKKMDKDGKHYVNVMYMHVEASNGSNRLHIALQNVHNTCQNAHGMKYMFEIRNIQVY